MDVGIKGGDRSGRVVPKQMVSKKSAGYTTLGDAFTSRALDMPVTCALDPKKHQTVQLRLLTQFRITICLQGNVMGGGGG